MKNQIDIGLTVADALMSKRLTMVCTDKQVGLSGFARRVVQDASAKFDSAAIGRTHHLGIADLSKVGRMAAPEINEVAVWAQGVLQQNPEFSQLAAIEAGFGLAKLLNGPSCE